jgi:large subunit ribosomal protein L6
MSRIGYMPINIPSGVSVDIKDTVVLVKGPKGEEFVKLPVKIKVSLENNILNCQRSDDEPNTKALHGLIRSLINNCAIGVSEGFKITLDVIGTGYRAVKKGKDLEFSLGFSHTINVPPLGKNILSEEGGNVVVVEGSNKQDVGEQAARIRKLRKPNPYTGNGVKYRDEVIRRKAGKTAVGSE